MPVGPVGFIFFPTGDATKANKHKHEYKNTPVGPVSFIFFPTGDATKATTHTHISHFGGASRVRTLMVYHTGDCGQTSSVRCPNPYCSVQYPEALFGAVRAAA
jgi:hypothetical protein